MLVSPGVTGVIGSLLEFAGTDEELFGVGVELLEIMLLDVVPLDVTLLFSDEDVLLELLVNELPELSFDELLELPSDELPRLLLGRLWAELAVSRDVETFEVLVTLGSERLLQPQSIAVESAAESTILLMFLNFIGCFSPFWVY